MEPYNPNKPFIQMKLDGSLLDRMVEAGIPLSRALQYFRDNPEGSAFETLKTAAEDVVPFYGNYRHGGDWSDYAKEALLIAAPVPKKRGKFTVDEAATMRVNDWLKSQYDKEPANTPRFWALDRLIGQEGKPMSYYDRTVLDPSYTDLIDKQAGMKVFNEIESNFPNEYKNLIIQEPAYYGPDGSRLSDVNNRLSTKATINNHFAPEILESDGHVVISPNKAGQYGALQYTVDELNSLVKDYSKYQPYTQKSTDIMNNPNLTIEEKRNLIKQIINEFEADIEIDNLPD